MTTSISPDARRIWRAARGPAIVGAVIILAGIVITLLQSTSTSGELDPDSVAPTGSRALAHLLQPYGVQIDRVNTLDKANNAVTDNATLLVTQPDWVAPERLTALSQRAGHTVLVGMRGSALGEFGVGVRDVVKADAREPGCSLDAARAAGSASIGGVAYLADSSCYDGTLVRAGRITLLGGATPLTNDALDNDGNAALSLRLLGQHQRLVWYLPSLSDQALQEGQQSFYDLVPSGWWYALVEVVIAVLLIMLWRGRRLGPVVSEPLPVVVRAAETAEGRARLYRRARASDHAADALRRATLDRLIPMLGLTSDAAPAAVVERVAARTGRAGAEVHAILYGMPPSTESALVQMANELDKVLIEVRTTSR
jgi:hypothetical protein